MNRFWADWRAAASQLFLCFSWPRRDLPERRQTFTSTWQLIVSTPTVPVKKSHNNSVDVARLTVIYIYSHVSDRYRDVALCRSQISCSLFSHDGQSSAKYAISFSFFVFLQRRAGRMRIWNWLLTVSTINKELDPCGIARFNAVTMCKTGGVPFQPHLRAVTYLVLTKCLCRRATTAVVLFTYLLRDAPTRYAGSRHSGKVSQIRYPPDVTESTTNTVGLSEPASYGRSDILHSDLEHQRPGWVDGHLKGLITVN